MAATRFLKRIPGPLTWLLALLVRIYAATLRLRIDDRAGYLQETESPATIFVLWHDRILCLPALAPQALRTHTAVLVSRSRDGGYIAGILDRMGYDSIRGSSSRGGLAALRAMKRHLDDNKRIVIMPDGPRGPAHTVQKGAIWLARNTGAQVVPLSLNMQRPWRLSGWDRTQIPKPFSRGELVIGEPLSFGPDADDEEIRDAIIAGLRDASGDPPDKSDSDL